MTDLDHEMRDRYTRVFENFESSLNGHKTHPLQELRRKALLKLEETPFPGRKSEDWKYTAVLPILRQEYQYAPVPEAFHIPDVLDNPIGLDKRYRIVFVNGHLDASQSQLGSPETGLTISRLEDACDSPDLGDAVREAINQRIDHPGNAFELLNLAFSRQGVFIHAARNTRVSAPVEVIYLDTDSEQPYFTHPQIFARAERGSRLRIIERYESNAPGRASLTNAWHHFDVCENARLDYAKFQRESEAANHIHQAQVKQSVNSRYDAYILDVGGKAVRNTHSAYLGGENTETHLLGNYIATGSQSIDNQTFIDHAIPHCYSNELYKGIAAERGKGVFNGKILVRKDAQKTNAFQQNANMVLSPHATVNAKPQLEIFADDVKCSHGATIGQLDEKAVFYLRSRGIPHTQARRMLQKAFVDEVVDHADFGEIQSFAHAIISNKLSTIA